MKLKNTFLYNFFSSGLGWVVAVIVVLLFVFHDCSFNRPVQMKEDVLYIKPN